MDLAQTLRSAIDASGKSRYKLAEETGVPEGRINTFMRGKDLRLKNAGKLMAALGLEVTRKKRQA